MKNSKSPRENQKDSSLKKPLLIALISMLVLLVLWHLLLPILGIAIAITAAVWTVILITIALVAVAILLFYIFSGVGIVILSIFAAAWIVFAIALFPVVFPLLIPLLILLIFVAFIRKRKMQ